MTPTQLLSSRSPKCGEANGEVSREFERVLRARVGHAQMWEHTRETSSAVVVDVGNQKKAKRRPEGQAGLWDM